MPYTRYGGGSQYATVGAQSVNELKNYTVFDAKTGEALDGYSLDPNPITDKSRVVIGEDTRYRDDSLPGVVKIINSDTLTGSGFVVDAHTIATAAHCVFDYQHGDFQNSEHPGKGFFMDESPLSQPARNIRYNIDTSGGNSGGPVYVKTDVGNTTYYTVIGINTYNLKDGISNGGTQMTTELLHFYKNNPYLMW